MKKPQDQLTEQINQLISDITSYLTKDIPTYMCEKTDDIVPSMGTRGLWTHEIKKTLTDRFNDYNTTIPYINNNSKLNLIKNLINLKQEIEDLFYGINSKELNNPHINERFNKIKDIIDSLQHKDNFIYSHCAADNSKIVHDIHNILTNELPSYSSQNIENFINTYNPPYFTYELGVLIISLYNAFKNNENMEILLTNAKIDNFIQDKMYLENIKDYKNHAENILNDTRNIAKQVKQNFSIQASSPLLVSYNSELENLKNSIKSINKYIIAIFVLITILFIIKFALIFINFSFFNIEFINFNNSNTSYNFITFSALILSFSALLTYLIKDRKRLINTHDHLLLKKLELNSLPTYMSELTQDQRRDLYISLAPNYFNGISRNEEQNTSESHHQMEALNKILDTVLKK